MSKSLYVQVQFVTLHQKKPADLPSPSSSAPYLSVGGVQTSISKYGLDFGKGDPGDPSPNYDTFDYPEFSIGGATFVRPDSYGQRSYYTTEMGQSGYSSWRIVSVPDSFVIPPELSTGDPLPPMPDPTDPDLPGVPSDPFDGQAGLFAGWSVNSDGTLTKNSSGETYSRDAAEIGWIDIGIDAAKEAVGHLLERTGNEAWADALEDISDAVDRVRTVQDALQNIHSNAFTALETMLREDLTDAQIEALVDQTLGNAQQQANDAARELLELPDVSADLDGAPQQLRDEIVEALFSSVVGAFDSGSTGPNGGKTYDFVQTNSAEDFNQKAFAGTSVQGRALIAGSNYADNIRVGDFGSKVFAGGGDDNIDGGAGDDSLYGGNGDDWLEGYGGNNYLNGGLGDDYYFLSSGSDRIEDAGGADDTIFSSRTVSLTNYSGIEDVFLRSGAGAISASGDKLANTLWGNSSANVLNGSGGGDVLAGDKGKDLLIGGNGKDWFYFGETGSKNVDTIADFRPNKDTIALDGDVFRVGSSLSTAEFYSGRGVTRAHDRDDRVIYDRSSGRLYYDADGNKAGGVAAVHFATLLNKPIIDHDDFVIV